MFETRLTSRLAKRWTKYFLYVFLLVASATSTQAWAQTIRFDDSAKVSPAVLERARQGISQDVFVILDASAIDERQTKRRTARGLKFNDATLNEESNKELDDLKVSVFPAGRLDDASVIKNHKYVPILFVRVPNLKALARILADPRVTAVEENKSFSRALTQSLPQIGQPKAIASGKSGAGYRVAVLDTGTIYRTPAMTRDGTVGCRFRNAAAGWNFPSGPYIGDAGCRLSAAIDFTLADPFHTPEYWNFGDIGQGHGTSVAEIVVAVAPGASVDALGVFDHVTVKTTSAAVASALDWVNANLVNSRGKIAAVNISIAGNTFFTGECTSSIYSGYFSLLRANGVVPVVSTGNAGKKTLPEPACAPGAVRVGAVYDTTYPATSTLKWNDFGAFVCEETPKYDQVGCFSNSSSLVTLLAPGAFIQTLDAGGGGTSQAAPHVAGAVAVLRQTFPNDSVPELIARLTATGKSVTDIKNNVTKPRLDLNAAVSTVSSGSGGSSVAVKVIVTSIASLVIFK